MLFPYGKTQRCGVSAFSLAFDAVSMQVWELEASLDAKKAVCDRLERQLQLSANQMQRQHDVEERYSEAQRRLRSAESNIQQLQAELQVSLLHVVTNQQMLTNRIACAATAACHNLAHKP